MKSYTAIIAEDEIPLQNHLVRLLEQLWPELTISGLAATGTEAITLIKEQKPDIAFLDIKMPEKTGLQVARELPHPCKVIFVTAYDQFAIQAFENEALDYLLKPITEARLNLTIQRLKKNVETSSRIDSDADALDTRLSKILKMLEQPDPPDYLKLIKVKTGSNIRFVPTSKILFFKAEDKYTVVQTNGSEYLIKTPIKELKAQLDPELFWQVHRSAIVNTEKIDVIKRSFTNQMLIGFKETKDLIPVSRAYEHLFK